MCPSAVGRPSSHWISCHPFRAFSAPQKETLSPCPPPCRPPIPRSGRASHLPPICAFYFPALDTSRRRQTKLISTWMGPWGHQLVSSGSDPDQYPAHEIVSFLTQGNLSKRYSVPVPEGSTTKTQTWSRDVSHRDVSRWCIIGMTVALWSDLALFPTPISVSQKRKLRPNVSHKMRGTS